MKYSIWLLLLILCASAAFATQSFTVQADPVNDKIFIDEVAEYDLTIRNFDIAADRFELFTTNPQWQVYYENSIIRIDEKESAKFTLLLDPISTVAPSKKYSIPITVRSLDDDEEVTISLEVVINSDNLRTFKPSIFTDIEIGEDGQINPSKPFNVKVRVINKNTLDIKELQVKLESTLIEDSFVIPLGPKEQVTKVLTYQLPKNTEPSSHVFDIRLTADDNVLGVVDKVPVDVIAYQPGFTEDIVEDVDTWLYSYYEVTLTNEGNIADSQAVTFNTNSWERLFTTATVPLTYEHVENDLVASYTVELEPQETITLTVTTDYRLLASIIVAIIIIIIVAIVLYYQLRSPVVIKKRVQVMKSDDNQSTNKIKIVLDIKNRTSKMLEHIKIIERIPNITEIEKEFIMGTLKPTKIINNEAKGTLIRWDFSTLEPFEERIVTYTIRSKLSIMGDLSLPATIVKYNTKRGVRQAKETSQKIEE